MPKSKLVVVWGGDNILSSSIGLYLAAQENWQVVCISSQEELDDLALASETAPSDIVIIHQADQNDLDPYQLQLLHDHPSIKVISICLANNSMDVYSKQQISVRQASDLISAIENGS